VGRQNGRENKTPRNKEIHMKRLLIFAAAVALFASFAVADSVTVTVNGTNAITFSDAINASGWLDRVEIVKSGDTGTCDIVLGTYSGTTSLEKFVNIDDLAEGTDSVVLRPRAVGTLLTAGTALSASTTTYAGDATNGTNAVVTTILMAPYERFMIGGNTKLAVTSTTNAVITATLYFERLAK
jgi:hypothetical protein